MCRTATHTKAHTTHTTHPHKPFSADRNEKIVGSRDGGLGVVNDMPK